MTTVISNEGFESFGSMEGITISNSCKEATINSDVDLKVKIECVHVLVAKIDYLFLLKNQQKISPSEFNTRLVDLFSYVDLATTEINQYTFWDSKKPYTRNLMALDSANYSLLILCWTNGKESKIHNHPGEGCYMKTIRGSVRETRYAIDPATGEITQTGIKFLSEGQGAFTFHYFVFIDLGECIF